MPYPLLAFLTILLTAEASASGSVFVGNAGDVVRTADGTYLFDFYKAGQHLSPFVGASADPARPPLPDQDLIVNGYPAEIIARKLSDFDLVIPGLGDYVLAAMKLFHWRFVEAESGPSEETYGPGRRYKIAARAGGTITISLPAWRELNEENRAGLLLHEAISGLLLPFRETGSDAFVQSQEDAIEITSLLFSPDTYRKNPAPLEALLDKRLAIPTGMPLSRIRQEPAFVVSVGEKGGAPSVRQAPVRLGGPMGGATELRAFVREVCEARPVGGRPADVLLEARVETNGINIEFDWYPIGADSGLPRQNFVRISKLNSDHESVRVNLTKEGSDACVEQLAPLYLRYLNAQIWL